MKCGGITKMKKKILVFMFGLVVLFSMFLVIPMTVNAEVGQVFTSDSLEGIPITFLVLTEEGNTGMVQVGIGEWGTTAISAFTAGKVSIPSTVTNGGKTYTVTTIGSSAFEYCYMLESVIIPDSVTRIDYDAFYSCEALQNIYFEGDEPSVGWSAFYSCAFGATAYVHPDAEGFTENGYFWNGLVVVDGKNMADVFVLDGILYMVLTEDENTGTVQVGIGSNEFTAISADTTIVSIPQSVTNGGKIYTVTSIDNNAFYSCEALKSVIIPNSVTSIGDYAFEYCNNLENVSIGSSVTYIGYFAFADCRMLESVVIPKSVTSIENCAFTYCESLKNIYFEGDAPSVGGVSPFDFNAFGAMAHIQPDAKGFTENGFFWNGLIVGIDGEAIGDVFVLDNILYKVISEDGDIGCVQVGIGIEGFPAMPIEVIDRWSIPSSITHRGKTYSVTSISKSAFFHHVGLMSLYIPSSVTNIGDYAFALCPWLSGLYFDGDAPSVGDYAFYNYEYNTVAYIRPDAKGFPEEGERWHDLLVVVLEDSSVFYGDIFSDGEIDSKDIVKLMQYLAGWPSAVLSDEERKAADTFADGVIDSKDVVKLAQYLAGWQVYLGRKD